MYLYYLITEIISIVIDETIPNIIISVIYLFWLQTGFFLS